MTRAADSDAMSTTTTSSVGITRTGLRARVTAVPVVLTGMIALATIVQFLAALPRASATYLPDEYLYTQLARSLGNGDGSTVLGQTASLPAMLEPLMIAALWTGDDAIASMHMTQALHSLLMAVAAVPVYLIARQLRLSTGAALVCSLISLVAPGLTYAGYLTADAVGYLLALVAIHAGVRAIARPTAGAQAWFLATAGLATFARLQYATLFVAFVVAVLVVERFRPLKALSRFRVVAAVLGLGTVVGAIVGSQALGRYGAVTDFGVSLGTIDWTVRTTAFLLAATGVALAAPALAWALPQLVRSGDRARTAFAALTLTLLGTLVAAAAMVSADTGSERFLERYLLIAFPLVAVGFFCWIDQQRPGRAIVVAAGAVVIIAAARVPVTGDLVGQGSADSPTLHAISRFGGMIGLVEASLAAALITTACAVLALGAAFSRRVPAAALVVPSVLVLGVVSAGAHAADLRGSERAFDNAFTTSATWVEDAKPGPTLLVQTPQSNPYIAMVTTIFNPSIVRAEGLGTRYVIPLDGLGTDPVSLGKDGVLRERNGSPVADSVLLATGGSSFVFAKRDRTVADKLFTLVVPRGDELRVSAYAAGARSNNSIAPEGWLTAYPGAGGTCNRATLKLTIPLGVPPTVLEFRDGSGKRWRKRIVTGKFTSVSVDSTATESSTLWFEAKQLGTIQGTVSGGGPGGRIITNVATGHLFAQPTNCGN